MATAHKKGISSLQLARDLDITQKSAWFVLHRIREMLKDNDGDLFTGNMVEVDETYVGGKAKNKSLAKRKIINKGRAGKGYQGNAINEKSIVFGIIQREGRVRTFVVPNNRDYTLLPIIRENVEKGNTMVSDQWKAYEGLGSRYDHHTVNHGREEYVRGNLHTNTIEGYFGLFKRGIYGIYHNVSPKHLQRYCDEFGYRYNNRDISDPIRFKSSLTRVEGRLTYKRLIAKEGNAETVVNAANL